MFELHQITVTGSGGSSLKLERLECRCDSSDVGAAATFIGYDAGQAFDLASRAGWELFATSAMGRVGFAFAPNSPKPYRPRKSS